MKFLRSLTLFMLAGCSAIGPEADRLSAQKYIDLAYSDERLRDRLTAYSLAFDAIARAQSKEQIADAAVRLHMAQQCIGFVPYRQNVDGAMRKIASIYLHNDQTKTTYWRVTKILSVLPTPQNDGSSCIA